MTKIELRPVEQLDEPEKYSHAFPHVNSRVALCGFVDKRKDYVGQTKIPDDACPICLALYNLRNG